MHLPRRVVVALTGPAYRLSLHPRLSYRVQRRLSEASVRLLPLPQIGSVEHVTLAGRPCERTTVGASERPRAILYLHGGGYVIGSPRMYRPMAAHLARAAGAVVFNLGYRLAPEHPFPAALDDAVAAFSELVDVHGFDPARIAIAGDSAGGGLAVAAARRLVDAGRRPGALCLLSPWTEPSDTDLPVRDFVVTSAWGRASAALYLGDASAEDPGYAPMLGSLRDLPPMLIHTGRLEMMNRQITRFAARAEAAGVEVTLVEHPALWHSGHLLAGMLREATDAVSDAGGYLRTRLDLPVGSVPRR